MHGAAIIAALFFTQGHLWLDLAVHWSLVLFLQLCGYVLVLWFNSGLRQPSWPVVYAFQVMTFSGLAMSTHKPRLSWEN